MNPPRDHDFDSRLRQLHSEALEQMSVRTRAQLTLRQSAATSRRASPSRKPGWALASACAVGVLALGLTWRLLQPSTPSTPPAAVTAAPANDFDDAYAVFDESPDLYLWLDSEEATAVLE
ncbi:MAG TPA: hypothetical protein VGQ93_10370 [Lysobacter sp.]|jgi:predicted benzoate:H+ symporter BenE|nr:hypothetical protein [Lysobacter sp.]